MAQSKNSFLSEFASSVNTSGKLPTSALATTPGVTVYDSIGSLPYSGNDNGNQAYVQSNNRLYIWDSVGWYSIALINTAPNISSITDSDGGTTPFTLADDGSTQTVITITAADSDGDPITYSVIKGTGFDSIATLSQDSSVFTITPFSQDSAGTATSGTLTFKATDGINVVSSAAQTFTLNFVSGQWKNVALSIGTSDSDGLDNSTFIDRSTNAHTVTTTGTPIQSAFHPYLDNYSVYFDGDGDYFKADMSNVAIGTNNFTIEMWIWPDEIRACTLLDCRPSASATPFNVGLNSSGQLALYAVTSYTFNYSANNAVIPGQWNHICFERRGTELKGYLNGSWKESFSSSVSLGSGASAAFIGANLGSGSGSNFFKGYMTNLHIRASGSTSASDFKYGDNFTPSTDPFTTMSGTVFLGLQDARYKDNSTNDTTFATGGGTPQISPFTLYGQSSEYSDTSNKGSYYNNASTRLDITNISSITGDFTIEGWLYQTEKNNGGTVFELGSYTNGILFRIGGSAPYDNLYVNGTSHYSPSADFTINEWHHFAIVRSGTTLTLYKNGDSLYSGTVSGNIGSTDIRIGDSRHTGTVQPFLGWISDFKISVGTAIYTSTFTPPTSSVGNTNADLYLSMDNAGIYDITGNNTLTPVGNTATSTTQTKFADTAMYFDGTGDYITTTIPGGLGSGDFTIEGWAYHTSLVDWISWVSSTRGSTGFNVGTDASGDVVWYDQVSSSSRKIEATNQLSTNTWYHFAFVRSSGVIKAYIDGTQVGSSYSSTANYSAEAFGIGDTIGAIGEEMYGYLENVQILKDTAKYTTNFTAPTATQGRTYQATS